MKSGSKDNTSKEPVDKQAKIPDVGASGPVKGNIAGDGRFIRRSDGAAGADEEYGN